MMLMQDLSSGLTMQKLLVQLMPTHTKLMRSGGEAQVRDAQDLYFQLTGVMQCLDTRIMLRAYRFDADHAGLKYQAGQTPGQAGQHQTCRPAA